MASVIRLDTIQNPTGVTAATVNAAGSLYVPGSVVQVKTTRYDTAYSLSTGTVAEITPLRVSITPKFANSLILCTFQIHGEGASTHDYIYTVFKNGSMPGGTYAGYNTAQGNQYWSGIAQALPYESDYSSTPFTQHMTYFDFPNSTSEQLYAPGIRNAQGSNYTYYINRTVGSTGSANHEFGVCMSIAMEIAQ